MTRWEPDAKGRLSEAALDLFVERGYDQTTVADIAAAAGLTERTFFRHFSDKREVLFWGGELLEQQMAAGARDAPAAAGPLEAVAAGLAAAVPFFDGRRARSRRRQGLVDAHPELQERELAKMARLADALVEALGQRGVADAEAAMAAEAGIAAFRRAWSRWIGATRGPSLAQLIDEHLAALRSVTGG